MQPVSVQNQDNFLKFILALHDTFTMINTFYITYNNYNTCNSYSTCTI